MKRNKKKAEMKQINRKKENKQKDKEREDKKGLPSTMKTFFPSHSQTKGDKKGRTTQATSRPKNVEVQQLDLF